MIAKTQCLYVFLLLYGGAILTVFIRAFIRRSLLEEYETQKKPQYSGKTEGRLQKFVFSVPRQIMALRDLGKSIGSMPVLVQRRHRRFRILTWIAIGLIVLLVVFSFGAHRVCEA